MSISFGDGLYVYASSDDYKDEYADNRATDFYFRLKQFYPGNEVALLELELSGDSGEVDDFYVTCDAIVQLSVVGRQHLPVLRRTWLDPQPVHRSDMYRSRRIMFQQPRYISYESAADQRGGLALRFRLVNDSGEELKLSPWQTSDKLKLKLLLHLRTYV